MRTLSGYNPFVTYRPVLPELWFVWILEKRSYRISLFDNLFSLFVVGYLSLRIRCAGEVSSSARIEGTKLAFAGRLHVIISIERFLIYCTVCYTGCWKLYLGLS